MSQTATQAPVSGAAGASSSSDRPTSRWYIAFLVIAASLSPILTIWSGNVGLIPKLERIGLIALAYLALGTVLFWLARRVLGSGRLAAYVTFFTMLVLTAGGQVLDSWPWAWRWAAGAIAIAVVSLVVVRLRDLWAMDVLLAALAAALVLPPLLGGVWASAASGEPERGTAAPASVPSMAATPDIVLVVLDGYTSLPVLRELFGHEDPQLRSDLARSDFRVIEPVFTPYSMTHLAVASLLQLDYVDESAESIADRLGGDNRLVDILSGNGYEITMVEPGWHMSECGDAIDHCVPSPFVDESIDAVLSQSLFWGLIEPRVGSAFTSGASHSMRWAVENVERLAGNGRPDFVFVHVVAPHPPLFLDGSCAIVGEGRRRVAGFAEVTSAGPDVVEARLSGYVGQVECVNRFVRTMAESLAGSDSVVFITGDHGSDALSQLATPPNRWSVPQTLDRMGTFLTVKAPAGCLPTSPLTTLSAFRSVVACAGDLDLGPIDDKAFAVSRAEVGDAAAEERALDEAELERLGHCLTELDASMSCDPP